ncbi:head GIN domain-containing protein [Persicitalea sp.]|uniref:head GIN domain-containing protein n=1 Tax=Persicitalea sp. TaxID=3100273 RepID=UPI0035942078
MKKLLPFCFLLFVATSCSAQSKGPERTRTLKVSDFSKLDLGSAFKIDVERGSSYRVTVTGKEDDLDDLDYGVSRGRLHIGYRNNSWRKSRESVRVEITMPDLDGVNFSGACNAKVKGFRGGRGMNIDVSGASRVEMDFTADKVFVDLSGASRLVLIGRGDNLEGEMSGASTFDGKDFPVKEANIDASGASKASVVASSALQADASGASSIRYSGSVSQVRSSSSGAGSVRRAN